MNKYLNESILRDLILCDPITRKGKEALNNLGLTDLVTPDFFYDKLRIPSIYDEKREFKEITVSLPDRDAMFYQYTIDKEQYNTIKEHQQRFITKLSSSDEGDSLFLLLGVAGNGKTIEVNRIIRKKLNSIPIDIREKAYVYIDLEKTKKKVTYGDVFAVPQESPSWSFCASLLIKIMDYIERLDSSSAITLLNQYNSDLLPFTIGSKEQRNVLMKIGKPIFFPSFLKKSHEKTKSKKREIVFRELNKLINNQSPGESIQNLFEMLMLIMYCACPNETKYIVIDNLEEFIMLDNNKLQIPDEDIALLYRAINDSINSIDEQFSRKSSKLTWKQFKIIILPRRTTLGLLHPQFLQDPTRNTQRVNDITGYFQISDIWAKKKAYLWADRLESMFPGEHNKAIIQIMDIITSGGAGTLGWSYQSLIAPLMSYGIRRNAYAQAHAAIMTYEYLSEKTAKTMTMSIESFLGMMTDVESAPSSARYMLRRALLEIQFKWPLSQPRWKNLQLGTLGKQSNKEGLGVKLAIHEFIFPDENTYSLARRILACLSYYSNNEFNSWKKAPSEMFSTASLYDLVTEVLVNPLDKEKDNYVISDEEYQSFARVLIALGDMDNNSTKSSPYVILNIKDIEFHSADGKSEQRLAQLLKDIVNEGSSSSKNNGKYNICDYGARITDAGVAFLCDWQPSFSFFFALTCYTIPPLFFIKDVRIVKYILNTVYETADKICCKYEEEAEFFCVNTEKISLHEGHYLPRGKGSEKITFRQRVKKLHIDHLDLYQDYLKRCYRDIGISEEDKEMLIGTSTSNGIIMQYKEKYNKWKVDEGAVECF